MIRPSFRATPKVRPKPYEIVAYELLERLLFQAHETYSTAGKFLLRTMKKPADRAQARMDKPTKSPENKEWERAFESARDSFSKFVRKRGTVEVSPGRRRGQCITCKKVKDYEDLQCGHWISAGKWGTRFHEYNAHAQCWACNSKMYGAGKVPEHEQYILGQYGQVVRDRLVALAKDNPTQPRAPELRAIAEKYQIRTAQIP